MSLVSKIDPMLIEKALLYDVWIMETKKVKKQAFMSLVSKIDPMLIEKAFII